jgi:hypothetical protein
MGISIQNSPAHLSSTKAHSLAHSFSFFLPKTVLVALSFFPYTHPQEFLLNFVYSLSNFLFLLLLIFMLEFAELVHFVFLLHVARNLPYALLVPNDIFKRFLFHLVIGSKVTWLCQVSSARNEVCKSLLSAYLVLALQSVLHYEKLFVLIFEGKYEKIYFLKELFLLNMYFYSKFQAKLLRHFQKRNYLSILWKKYFYYFEVHLSKISNQHR